MNEAVCDQAYANKIKCEKRTTRDSFGLVFVDDFTFLTRSLRQIIIIKPTERCVFLVVL